MDERIHGKRKISIVLFRIFFHVLGVKKSCFLGWDKRLDVAASSMPDNQYKYIK